MKTLPGQARPSRPPSFLASTLHPALTSLPSFRASSQALPEASRELPLPGVLSAQIPGVSLSSVLGHLLPALTGSLIRGFVRQLLTHNYTNDIENRGNKQLTTSQLFCWVLLSWELLGWSHLLGQHGGQIHSGSLLNSTLGDVSLRAGDGP